MSYTHFTLSERESLQFFLNQGKSFREIAKIMGRSPSTISREVKRNWSKKATPYHNWHAPTNYKHRRKACHRKNNLQNNKEMYQFVFEGLLQYWSPEIVAG